MDMRPWSTSRFILNKRFYWLTGYLLILSLFSTNAWSHAFGQRYDLPLPLGLYLVGAGIVVAVSFIVTVLFLRGSKVRLRRLVFTFGQYRSIPWFTVATIRVLLKLASVFLFILIILSGQIGEQDAASNFAPVFIWVIWWVGLAYVAAFIGNVWDLVNPWRAIYEGLMFLLPRWRYPMLEYPAGLAAWPAVVLFLIFAYLEFISGVGQHPATLVWLVIGYSLITLAGMRVYGVDTWLQNGEAFSVVFGLMARFGLLRGDGLKLELRVPGTGLLTEQPISASMMAFTILMLTTVSFDGFIETPFWSSLNASIYTAVMVYPSVAQSLSPVSLQQLILSAALVLFYLLYIGVYLVFCYISFRLSRAEASVMVTARAYVLSLVPIAIAYHLAHYLSYLLLAGQLIIPVISDPFALGWNLFGTRNYQIDISVIGAREVWYLSVAAIVIGHIAAVCIAHVTALRREPSEQSAIISQLPMLLLMITYTMISLWILSQPIIA
jgi:hypothetical protein